MPASAPSDAIDLLLDTPTLSVWDHACDGRGDHACAPACRVAAHLLLPYRGVYVRHLDGDAVVADASQVLFCNAGDEARITHPVPGGDASLMLRVEDALLREIAPPALLREGAPLAFDARRKRIDPRAQVLVALLRHSLRNGLADTLEAESLGLTLVQRSLGARTAHAPAASAGRQRLVDRAKLVLMGDLARRWTLAAVGAEVGVSPVYLTQSFQQVEGVPLYRYHLRLRLARALDLLAQYEDLTALSLDLGFSSHSHFSAAFQQAYGRSPTEFRQTALER